MKEIHAGQRVWCDIHQSQCYQTPVFAVLEFSGKVKVTIKERLGIIIAIDLAKWPLASAVHVAVVAVIQQDMFSSHRWFLHFEDDLTRTGNLAGRSSLAAGGAEFQNVHSQALARRTCLAFRAKQRPSKASPTSVQQVLVPSFRECWSEPIDHPGRLAGNVGTRFRRAVDFHFPIGLIL